MVKITTTTRTLEFVGPPRRLVAVGDIPPITTDTKITGPLAQLLQDGQALRLRGGRRRNSGASLRLSTETAPGDYKGQLSIEEASIPVIARVLPDPRVSILVGDLAFFGPLDMPAKTTLVIANTGNTEIVLPRALPIALFDDDGLETAFAASYAEPRDSLDAFFSVFHSKLREAHSGIMKLAVSRGYGTHAPGTSFCVDFTLKPAKSLRSGRRYHGVASMDFAEFPITLSVINGVAS